MRNILVSLVIPAYNVENLIGHTLDSVINQTLKGFECIVVDDFSTDNTKGVVSEYVKRDKRFKLLSHRANAGLSAARNTGLRFAKGKFVAFLDSDDLLMQESLELRANTLNKYSNDTSVIGTYSGSITIPMNAKEAPVKKPVKLKTVDFITASGNCPFNANQPMFKTEQFKKFGGFDHSLKQAEDYDMWIRILRAGYVFKPTELALVTYRKTEGSMIKSNPLLHLDTSYKRFISCYEKYPKECWNRKQKVNLSAGLSEYLAELNIANRVLEFIGLGLAKGDSKDQLVERLGSYLPNYFQIIERHRPFEVGIAKGINRYFGESINFDEKIGVEFKKKTKDLYNLFFAKVNKSNKISEEIFESVESTEIVNKIGCQRNFDVVFIPHKDYHVHAIKLLKPFLDEKKIKYVVLDVSMHYRDEGVKNACESYQLPRVGYSNFVLGDFEPRTIVCFNDWDPIVRSIIKAANVAKIPTLGIVEGIQDYHDADTKQQRFAYRTVSNLALPGEHDRKYFTNSEQNIFVGGIPRIYDLYQTSTDYQALSIGKRVLINSNFSYGVLEEHRDSWLTSAVNACQSAGYEVIISRHPADKGTLYDNLTTTDNFYKALGQCDVLISRFASGILEALAVKKLPIYFNPHNEKVDKFKSPDGAYPIVKNEDELVCVLNSLDKYYSDGQKKFHRFLELHAGSLKRNPSKIIAEELTHILAKRTSCSYKVFYKELERIDVISGSFNNLKVLKSYDVSESSKERTYSEEPVLSMFYRLLRNNEYVAAKNLITSKTKNEPDNPVYQSCERILNIFSLKVRDK